MRRPDFLIIGAARSSTSALARYLDIQPSVFICDPKEPHFLVHADDPPKYEGPGDDFLINSRVVTQSDDYFRLFDQAPSGSIVGEGSVSTLAYPAKAIPNIKEYCADDVKLIVCLRDPIERMFSSFMYLRSRSRETIPTFVEALGAESERIEANWHHMWRYRALSRYDLLLPPFIQAFGRERVHIVISERLEGLESPEFQAIASFLELEDVRQDSEFGQINASGEPGRNVVARVAMAVVRNEFLLETAKAVVPRSVQEKLHSRIFDRPTIDESLRDQLFQEFEPVVESVESLVGPLPEWRPTTGLGAT